MGALARVGFAAVYVCKQSALRSRISARGSVLAGDLGCSAGPAAVGFAAEKAGGDLKSGLLLAVIFPAALLACALAGRKGGARNGPF